MDLTPFFTNVGRIADALERIAVAADVLTKPTIIEEQGDDLALGSLGSFITSLPPLKELLVEPKLLLAPAVKAIEVEADEATEAPPEMPADPLDATILEIFEAGTTTLNGIASELNRRGVQTARGGKFYAATLTKTFDRLGLKSSGGSFRSMRGIHEAEAPAKGGFIENLGTHPSRRRRPLPPPPDGKTDQDLIAEAVAAGRVTKLPACIDSRGYNHETGKEA